jgi:NADH-quinone oxidoreductase subunit N
MTLGNLAVFFQTSVQRPLAYPTISQVGYLLMAVVVAVAVAVAGLALPALLFCLAAYAVTNLGAFAVVAELPAARGIQDYRGLARADPWLAAALVICLFGLVGTAPTAVFVGKLTIFSAAIDGGLAGWPCSLCSTPSPACLLPALDCPGVRNGTRRGSGHCAGSGWAVVGDRCL